MKINNNLNEKMGIKNRNSSQNVVSLHKKFSSHLQKQNEILENNQKLSKNFPSFLLLRNITNQKKKQVFFENCEQIFLFLKNFFSLFYSLEKSNHYERLLLKEMIASEYVSETLQVVYQNLSSTFLSFSSSLKKLFSHLRLLFSHFFQFLLKEYPFQQRLSSSANSPPPNGDKKEERNLQDEKKKKEGDEGGEEDEGVFSSLSQNFDFSNQEKLFLLLQKSSHFKSDQSSQKGGTTNEKGNGEGVEGEKKNISNLSFLEFFDKIEIAEENIPFILKQILSSVSLIKQTSSSIYFFSKILHFFIF